ncbi:hypothetical protein PUR49_32455 [Streptomyces sp. BE147]|uniref:hypothetical protein n=1 Tax=Streptomyces sp. BE147 TaxID=3002524 RepID=UPI002E75D2C7|nr:hypothetical protein [Streptomyces sp. BE147]MEE1741185.1 hypothetical protein [Streptomyces sp. BE147]
MDEPMTWSALTGYLDHTHPVQYRDSISTLLCTAGTRISHDKHPDQAAERIQTAVNSYREQRTNAFRHDDGRQAGFTVLAAHTAAIWLSSFLHHHLPRRPGGEPDLHQNLDDFATAVWGTAASWNDVVKTTGQLQRSTAPRAQELRSLHAHTAVRDLTGYTTASSIQSAHGRLVHNTLRLALPHDRQGPHGDRPAHLTLAHALEQAMCQAGGRAESAGAA